MYNSWLCYVDEETFTRLCECRTIKNDIPKLVDAKWRYWREIGTDKKGFTKEDALIQIMELISCNSQDFNLTEDEYKEIIK